MISYNRGGCHTLNHYTQLLHSTLTLYPYTHTPNPYALHTMHKHTHYIALCIAIMHCTMPMYHALHTIPTPTSMYCVQHANTLLLYCAKAGRGERMYAMY